MNCPFGSTSLEVATSSRFLQNAGCYPRLFWNKRMLAILVSMLCASCGSSGVPSDPQSTTDSLQGSESVTAIATSDSATFDSIVSPGYSGFSVSEAQVPVIAAAESVAIEPSIEPSFVIVEPAQPDLSVAAIETEVEAPGQPVSSAMQELGVVVTAPEPVAQQTEPAVSEVTTEEPVEVATVEEPIEVDTAEEEPVEAAVIAVENETGEAESSTDDEFSPDAELSPEAEIELAALEAELAQLQPVETETPPVVESDSNDDEQGTGTVSKTVSYDSIAANGLGNGTYVNDDYYLAEFLYQNPDTCFWEQDNANRTITSIETPMPPENSVYMPSPSGGDDTSMLEEFFRKNAGKSVDGDNRTYKVKTLDIKDRIDIFNMAMEPASGAKQMVRISAPDVRIFNSPINGKNLGTLAIGFNVEDGAHRFVLVNSEVKDLHHKQSENAAAVFIRGANDFQIVCNRFENIFNSTSDKSKTARANSIWMAGRNEHNLSGGLIANNYSNDHQSNGKLTDAEFFTIQSYKSVSTDNPVRLFANRAINAGKRFTKNQEGSTIILSNYIEWNTRTGPLGVRRLIAPFVVQQSNDVTIRNNRVNISAEGNFDAVFKTDASTGAHTSHLGGSVQSNIHFDSNDIEIKDNPDPNAKTGPILMRAMASHVDLNATGHEAKNSSANNNNVHGTGSLKNYFVFLNGYSDNGGRFEHKNNVFSIPFYKSEYR